MASGRDGGVAGSIRTLFEDGASSIQDDAQLLERFLGGRDESSEAAFAALVARHGPMVLGVCKGILRDAHDSHDAFQATFLILARKAGSIRRRESLAGWLFGVGRKVANRAKADAARRRARELAAVDRSTDRAAPARDPDDLAALYEEIDRLPETYREPVILCYLDGLTYEAAASRLRCPLGTLSIRLRRARERLRSRLTRRGVTVPAGLLVAGGSTGPAWSAVPASLVGLASRAIRSSSAIQPTGALAVSASVVSLVEGTMGHRALGYRAAGIGSLGLGVVVLAATIASAMKAPDEDRAAAGPPKVVEGDGPWRKTLPSGVVAELIAVSDRPAQDPVVWRRPDGSPLDVPPYERSNTLASPFPHQSARDFAVRVTRLPATPAHYRWEVIPSQFRPMTGDGYKDNRPLPGLSVASVALDKDLARCKVRLGIASAPWKTLATAGPDGDWGPAGEKAGVIYSRVRRSGGKASLALILGESPDEFSVTATDLRGRELRGGLMRTSEWEGLHQFQVEFEVPASEIGGFAIGSRPIEWAEFDDVALHPRR